MCHSVIHSYKLAYGLYLYINLFRYLFASLVSYLKVSSICVSSNSPFLSLICFWLHLSSSKWLMNCVSRNSVIWDSETKVSSVFWLVMNVLIFTLLWRGHKFYKLLFCHHFIFAIVDSIVSIFSIILVIIFSKLFLTFC